MKASLEKKQEELEARRSRLEAQKNRIINQTSTRNKKEELRLKILIGTGVLEDLQATIATDIDAYSVKKAALKSILDSTIDNESSRDFLKQYGYI